MAFPAQMVPPGGSPPKPPPGSIIVMGEEGGYAVPPRRYALLFGRQRDDVHVPVGVGDSAVSRLHGVLSCVGDSGEWWLKNTGRLPIKLPGGKLVLTGHERRMEPGLTPLVIASSPQCSHLLKVSVISREERQSADLNCAKTTDPKTVYELTPPERLVLTALALRYLQGHSSHPLPLSWKQVAQMVNRSPHGTRHWDKRSAEHTVAAVREHLHKKHGVPDLTLKEVGGPVGSALTQNLIKVLLETTTLTPHDLALLGEAD
jgi:hypothetical protein